MKLPLFYADFNNNNNELKKNQKRCGFEEKCALKNHQNKVKMQNNNDLKIFFSSLFLA